MLAGGVLATVLLLVISNLNGMWELLSFAGVGSEGFYQWLGIKGVDLTDQGDGLATCGVLVVVGIFAGDQPVRSGRCRTRFHDPGVSVFQFHVGRSASTRDVDTLRFDDDFGGRERPVLKDQVGVWVVQKSPDRDAGVGGVCRFDGIHQHLDMLWMLLALEASFISSHIAKTADRTLPRSERVSHHSLC